MESLGFRIQDSGLSINGLGFWDSGLEFRVYGLGSRFRV